MVKIGKTYWRKNSLGIPLELSVSKIDIQKNLVKTEIGWVKADTLFKK